MGAKTQWVEIDLRSGVLTNAPLSVIGPRLWKATNSVWDYRYPLAGGYATNRVWTHRQPLTFPVRDAITFTGVKSFRDLGFSFNAAFDAYAAMIGCNESNQYAVWPDTGGAEVGFAGGVTRATVAAESRMLGCSANWLTPGTNPNGGAALAADEGVLVFSHPLATHVYYLLDSASTIRSLTTDVTNCPAGCGALAVHLDRLWLLEAKGTITNKLWYTDPFNLDSIRTTNVLQFPDKGMALFPGQFGTIDTSGVPHLVIGCANSVYVLDGDPILGGGLQADVRVLGVGVGMISSQAGCVTPYGVFFLGTDGDLWHIPPGCQSMAPVGGPIRNHLGINNRTGEIDADGTATGTLAWLDPYLYIFPGGETSWALLAQPSTQGEPTFWGPITTSSTITPREAIVRVPTSIFGLHAPSGKHVLSVHSIDTVPSVTDGARYLAFDPYSATTGSYPHGTSVGRVATVQTGLLTVPGHYLQARQVMLETLAVPRTSVPTTVAWTVTVVDEHGNSVTGVRHPESAPAYGTNDISDVQTQHFAIPPLTASRGVSVRIAATTEANLGLQRAFVKLHQTPAQF